MKKFLWINKLLFLIFFLQYVSSWTSNYINLSLNKSGKSYYELKTVCNIILWYYHPLLC